MFEIVFFLIIADALNITGADKNLNSKPLALIIYEKKRKQSLFKTAYKYKIIILLLKKYNNNIYYRLIFPKI